MADGDPRRETLVVFSNHLADARRRTSIHFIVRRFLELGWAVDFVTAGLSPLSWLRRDPRLREPACALRNVWRTVAPGFRSFVWWAPFHPANLRSVPANRIAAPLFRLYPWLLPSSVRGAIDRADLALIESGAGVTLMPVIRRRRPDLAVIYRVSDTLDVLRPHPVIADAERQALPGFALVSCASRRMLPAFPGAARARVHPHGMDASAHRPVDCPSPYREGEVAVVSMGGMLFDAEAARRACAAAPDIRFHFFGAGADWPGAPNAVIHGERPFAELIPYLRHARAGAAFYRRVPGAEYLIDTSNKMMHFAMQRLPVIAPGFVADHRPGVVPYDATESSMSEAIDRALSIDRATLPEPSFPSWADVVAAMLRDLDAV